METHEISEIEQGEDWKEKYFKVLMECDEAEKISGEHSSQLYNELLTSFKHFRGHDENLDNEIAALPNTSQSTEVTIDTLKNLNRQIANLLDDMLSNNGAESSSELESLVDAKDSLEYFVKQLPVDISKQLDVNGLNHAFNENGSMDSLHSVADDIQQVLLTALGERNKKINELSSFLGIVAKRLDSLQAHLKDEEVGRQNSSDDRNDLSKIIGNNLRQIRESVAGASSIDVLKQTIDSTLDEVDSNVLTFFESETQRANKAEKSSAALALQLHKLQTESVQLKQSLESALSDSMVDPLTSIPNRRAYDERFQVEYTRWKRHQEPLTLAILDIDHFKNINDTYGHPIGDKVLKVVAKRIQDEIRESDFFGRIGGEEFAFIFANTDLQNATNKTDELRKIIEDCQFSFKQSKFQVTISIGIATFQGADDIDIIYSRADLALVKAKQTGRNKIVTELEL